jgi:hypothetical protein
MKALLLPTAEVFFACREDSATSSCFTISRGHVSSTAGKRFTRILRRVLNASLKISMK